jgi:glycosyltransferase involved in cell wall biosynthesis
MKVCLVNALFHPFTGGIEKHMLELSSRLVKRGVDVTVLTGCIGGTTAREKMNGVDIVRVPCKEIKLPGLYPPPAIFSHFVNSELAKLDAQKNFDIIHLQNRWFPDFATVAFYKLLRGKKMVMTIHNARPFGISWEYSLLGGFYDIFFGQWIFRAADKLISVSRWVREDIAKYGISPEKITPIPNGIDTNAFKPASRSSKEAKAVREKLGLGEDPVIIWVGRIVKQKGLRYMLDAMPSIIEKEHDAKLVIVGWGNGLNALKQQAVKLGIEKSVLFPGPMVGDQLVAAYQAADVFVLPSLWEVLSIAALEAMACGKPMVVSNAGGNPELVDEGKNGFVVPKRDSKALAEAVAKVLSDEKLRGKMSEASRLKAEKEFDWELITDKTLALYKTLVK